MKVMVLVGLMAVSLILPTTTVQAASGQPGVSKEQLCQNAVTALNKRTSRLKSDKVKKLALYKQQRKLWQSKVTEADRLNIENETQRSNLRLFDTKVAKITQKFNTEIIKSTSPKGTCAPAGKATLVKELKAAKRSRTGLDNERKAILQFTQSTDKDSLKSQHSELITKIRAKKK